MNFRPETIFLEEDAQGYPFTQKVLGRFPDVPVISIKEADEVTQKLRREEADPFGAGKRNLILSRFKGSFLRKCPGISPGMVCCNYYVVNLIKNCRYDCSYCFLQDFLANNPALTAFVNVEDLLSELEEVFEQHPDRSFRVGTGELTDSLAHEAFLPYAQDLVPFFNQHKNAVLELKTKSDCVDGLLQLPGSDRVIVSWSMNPAEVSEREETGTPGPAQRMQAALRCQQAGYRVGFHFDPVILFDGWQAAYTRLIDDMFDTLDADGIEWISLGSFRFRPGLKPVIRDRHPQTHLFTQEHVVSEDGKLRYLRPHRNEAYSFLREKIKSRAPDLNVYLCMETKELWEGVTGHLPRADEKLDVFFDL